VYLEIGYRSAALPFALADVSGESIGPDVTDALADFTSAPSNFRFVKTSGAEIPRCFWPSRRCPMPRLLVSGGRGSRRS
jgi:hypothetical protein